MMRRRRWALVAALWGTALTAAAYDSYFIDVPANVMKGDPDVTFTVTPYSGAIPDPAPHNIYFTLPVGVQTNPVAAPPGGLDWSSVASWGLITNAGAAVGNVSLTVTEAFAAIPITTTRLFNLQNTVRSFEVVPPAAFTGTAGVPFNITIRARDGLGGGGAVVTGFNDNVVLTAAIGDIIVNGSGNIVSGGDFVNGEATVSVAVLGTDILSRTNTIRVAATINYLSLGIAQGSANVNINPAAYDNVVLLFPGETLTPGKVLTAKLGAATPVTANAPVLNVIAYLVDQYHNPIITPAAPVTLAFESLSYPGLPRPPNDDVPPLAVINAGNGVVSNGGFVFYIGNETHQVRVRDFADPTKNSVSSVFVNSGLAALIEVNAVSSPQNAGTPFLVSARVVDGTPARNTVISYNDPDVAVTLTNCSGVAFPVRTLDTQPGVGGAQNTVAFANGVLNPTAIQVFPRANPVCLHFDDGAGRFGDSNPFAIDYGGVVSLLPLMPDQAFTPGQYLGYDNPPVPRVVGELVTVTVFVVDQGWNVINTVDGGWSPGPVRLDLVSGTGVQGYADTPSAPVMPASGAGVAVPNVRLRTAYPTGNGFLVANMSGLTGRSGSLTLNPRAYNRLVFVAPGETLAPGIPTTIEPDGKLGVPLDQAVNVLFPMDVHLTDDYFNTIINPPGGGWPTLTFSLTAPPAGIVSFPFSNPFPMPDGEFNNQMSLGILGANTVRVVDNTGKSINQNINVVPGPVNRFVVTPNPLSDVPDPIPTQTVGVPFNLTFKAFDEFGNLAKNFGGTVSLELWENGAPMTYGGVLSPSTITFVADPVTGGVVTQAVTITYAGQSLGLGADQLQVRAFINNPTVRQGLSSFFSMQELSVWSDIIMTLPGESRRPGLGVIKVGSPTPVTAGTSFSVTVTAVDVYGNRIDQAGVADLSSVTPGIFANLPSPPQVVLAQGVGVGFAQIYTAANATLRASVAGLGFQDESTVSVRPGSYAAATGRLVLLAPGEVLVPGSPSAPGKNSAAIATIQANTSLSLTILACDRFYNVDPTYAGNYVSLVSDDGAITRSNIAIFNGSTTVSGLFLRGNLPNPSLVRVTATDQSDTNKTSLSDVPVSPGALYQITVPATAQAGVNFPMTVSLLDPVTNDPDPTADNSVLMEAFLADDSPATVALNVGMTNLVNGAVTFDQNYGYVETIRIRVTDSYNRIAYSAPIDVLPNGLKYKVTLPAAAQSTDAIFQVSVGLYDTIQDAIPIRDTSYQHTFAVSVEAAGLPADGLFPVNSATLTDGEAVFNFSYTKAEHIVVRASGTVAGFPPLVGLDDMDIVPGAYVKVQLVAPGEVAVPGVPSLTGKDSSGLLPQAAHQVFAMSVNAVDRYWNVVTSYNTPLNPSVQVTADDGSLSLPLASYSNGTALIAGVQLAAPPQVTVTAQDISDAGIFPQSVVIPVTGRVYIASATPNFPPNFYSGPPRSFDVDLALYNFTGGSTGALVTGFSGDVRIEPLNLSLQPLPVSNVVILNPPLPDPTQNNVFRMLPSGVITLTLAYRVAEDVIFRFIDESGWQGYSDPIHFVPREIDYEATIPVEARVGPPDVFAMTVTARDRDTGTVAKNWTANVGLTPIRVVDGLPGTGVLQVASVPLDGGPLTFQQAYSQAGVFMFEMSDGVRTSMSSTINFLPGPLTALSTDLPDTLEAGTTRQILVTLLDAFGNPIPLQPVSFSLTNAALGVLSTLSGSSNVYGQASTVFSIDPQSAGPSDFIATSGNYSVREPFRVLGPPVTTLQVGGRGIELARGYSVKPGDPISIDAEFQPGMVLEGVYVSLDGGPFVAYTGPFSFSEVGEHVVRHYGVARSILLHTETTRTSRPIFVTADVTAEEGLVNYPNPFRAGTDVTFLEYVLSEPVGVRITIYDLMGQRVYERRYSQGEPGGEAGPNRISWDGRNGDGMTVSNGGYIVVLETADGRMLKRKVAVRK